MNFDQERPLSLKENLLGIEDGVCSSVITEELCKLPDVLSILFARRNSGILKRLTSDPYIRKKLDHD